MRRKHGKAREQRDAFPRKPPRRVRCTRLATRSASTEVATPHPGAKRALNCAALAACGPYAEAMRSRSTSSNTVPLRIQRRLDVDHGFAPPPLASFELGRRLGEGGMGVVYEARHALLQRRVALKFMHLVPTGPEVARARLLREARALARINHPNVVTIFELGITGDCVYIAMELVDGGTLADWIETPRDWRAIVDMFLALGRGLEAVHELGLVHRDIKPSNILLDRNGVPKIGDFGLAGTDSEHDSDARSTRPFPARTLTITNGALGTPAYMAPEQANGARIDARADQFAFCMSLHEALTGSLPGQPEARRAVPRPLRPILVRGLASEPRDRFPSMAALLSALLHVRNQRRSAVTALATGT